MEGPAGAGTDSFTRHWRLWLLLCWMVAVAWLMWERWDLIRLFALPDTDDNMRIMQVRGLLSGQGWFDLRQYRLDPPFGANIHWSRLVDLPLAAIMLATRPLVGGAMAEKIAVAVAPTLPMLLAMGAVGVIARRIISPRALLIPILLLMCAHSARLMWAPLRIDHHGWQLAFLSVAAASFTDGNRRRGGVLLGIATAASMTIGLEMLLYLALAGALVVLLWVKDEAERPRLFGYGVALAGGCSIGFLLFASYANRAPLCDALSPVWLSAVLFGGAICAGLGLLRVPNWPGRLAIAVAAGVLLAAAFAWSWPHCLGRLEGVSPEAQRLWLDNVREAKPIYRQSTEVFVAFTWLPAIGLVGYAVMLWRNRADGRTAIRWAPLAALALAAFIMLFWQTRAGGSAQLLAVPGAAGLAWLLLLAIFRGKWMIARVVGTVIGFLIVSGLGVQMVTGSLVKPEGNPARIKAINRANRLCTSMPALRPISLVPKGYVLTFVDLGPRLITVTHHDAVAGPYHRNYPAIVDVMQAWRGSADHAHEMIERRRIDYVLICPNFSESTNYQAKAPGGFYAQLRKGKVPTWLAPVQLPSDSPFRMWRVVRPIKAQAALRARSGQQQRPAYSAKALQSSSDRLPPGPA